MARPKSNASKIAFNFIKDKINRYDFVSGDTISDLQLSEELKMSRTPVREAIMELVQYNLVEKQKTKFVVKEITFKDIKEILEVRESIETMSATLIIQNGGLSEEQKKELVAIEKKLSHCLGVRDYFNNFKYDSLFHSCIVQYSNNSRLIAIMENLSIQFERVRWLSILTPNRYQNAIEEHREILGAINSGNSKKMNKYIHEHLKKSAANYEKITANENWEDMIISFKQAFNK